MLVSSARRLAAPVGFLVLVVVVVSLIAVSGALPDGEERPSSDVAPPTTTATVIVPVRGADEAEDTYTVRTGDTWKAISERVGVPAEELKAVNSIEGAAPAAGLMPGMVLRVPDR